MVLNILKVAILMGVLFAFFWFAGHIYCRILLWVHHNTSRFVKWGLVSFAYMIIGASVAVVPWVSLMALEGVLTESQDRIRSIVAAYLIGLLATILSTIRYRVELKAAGYWK